ncbi:hypothetical protein [Sphingobacterium sp. DR205]|uniref:hypothetical protein n=1 Tax=Sphingobacterium sp. DR205 TaxID=2713573 RepID=UPI0013E425F8|nr:hypothetical protein [Sphingobacterium sp. DR205]QIH34248.1 hypothetical protein G6053_15715 [Sphingobacterium sp. DR205]
MYRAINGLIDYGFDYMKLHSKETHSPESNATITVFTLQKGFQHIIRPTKAALNSIVKTAVVELAKKSE